MEVSFWIAFVAGLVSFLSPCAIPLIPAFLGYLTGAKIESTSRWELFKHSLLFVLGFSAVFALLGVLLNSILVDVAYTTQMWLNRIAGTIIVLFGLYLLGAIKPKFLTREHKLKAKKFKSKELTSFVFGAAFAVGWSPCVGAVLGTILALAASLPGKSFLLLLGFSIGLGIPFLLMGLFAHKFLAFLERSRQFLKYFNFIVGLLILVLGVLVFTGQLAVIVNSFGIIQ